MSPEQEHALLGLLADLASENESRANIIAALRRQLAEAVAPTDDPPVEP